LGFAARLLEYAFEELVNEVDWFNIEGSFVLRSS
jgi:hypothetical protein